MEKTERSTLDFFSIIKKLETWFYGTTGDNTKINNTNGSNQNIVGDNNNQSQINIINHAENKKDNAKQLLVAAIEDIRYNGPGVGNLGNPFKTNNIDNLIRYVGPYPLNENEKNTLRKYVHVANRCNSGKPIIRKGITPGKVQNQQQLLIKILEKYISK